MKKLFELRKKYKETLEKAQQVIDMAEKDNGREITDEEQTTFDELMVDADKIQAQIKRYEALENKLKNTPEVVENDETPEIVVGQPNILKDPKCGFNSMGEFAMQVLVAGKPGAAIDERLKIMAASGMNQASGADGGFLVPTQFSNVIYEGVMSASESLVGMCDTYPGIVGSIEFPAFAETARATGSRWGGVRGYWLGEAEQMTGSFPKLRKITIEPQELGVLVYATNKLLSNAAAIDRWITRSATDEISFMTGDAIVEGDGIQKPLGILNAGCVVEVAKETSQAADTIVPANINKMYSRLCAKSWGRAVWLINQDCLPQLDGLNIVTTDVAGTTTVGGFPTQMFNSDRMTLKGRPIIPVEYCKTVGDAGDIILSDMSAYVVGLAGGVESASSMHLRFDYNEMAFRFIYRVDGQPWLNSAITPFNSSNTQSTFITLAARA